ncbi:MAG: DUF6377 domain-containing protein [Salinivirgaceae bacterium]|jgi:hypothetical protein|nr:DUF6377 domain-containing protein [Salinivirgaceae bacterium]
MTRKLISLIGILLFSILTKASVLDSLFVQLEQVMDSSKIYDETKELKIRSLKGLINEPNLPKEQLFQLNKRLINEYEKYTFDSTIHYIEKNLEVAQQLKNASLINYTNLQLTKILTLSGRYKEAIDILSEINKLSLSRENLIFYFENYQKVYSELSFYSQVDKIKSKYKRQYKNYTDSLLYYLDSESDSYLSIIETRHRDLRQLDDCEKINTQRFNQAKMATPNYSLIAFERSLLYELQGDMENQKKYLILSAISDIKASVKDNASLTILAHLLYNNKQIFKAHRYINFSFNDAEFYNSRLRFIGISNILPLITEAYEVSVDQQKSKLRKSLIIISLLTFVLLFTVIYIYIQVKKLASARNELKYANSQLGNLNEELKSTNTLLNKLNLELSESNHVKEQYIGNFLGIWSNFIDKLNNYRKMVNKQIEARKVTELHQITKSRKLIDDELADFYENFDTTFLSIYPGFVEDFNNLLEDGEKINLKKGELLNTELRIFALIRLGITDSSKIAGLLRYSVRTIYNYRVKIKNKSVVPRDDFEDYILKIGAFS